MVSNRVKSDINSSGPIGVTFINNYEMFIIYKITNNINGKLYIGQTCRSITERWKNHKHQSSRKRTSSALHDAIRKYGSMHFSIEEMERVITKEEADSKEKHYIKLYDTFGTKNGYNLTKGGGGTVGLTPWMKGKKHTQETIKIIKEKRALQILPEDFGQKVSLRVSGKNNPMYGKSIKDYMTVEKYEEYKRKLRIKNSGKNNPMYGKKRPGNNVGKKHWFNGIDSCYREECPGDGWINKMRPRKTC